MVVTVENVALINVWEESFQDKSTGETVRYYRALLNMTGEPPAQLAVLKDSFEDIKAHVGTVGVATVEIDAQPGRRVRVILAGME